MADEVTYAGIATNARIAALLHREIDRKLYDPTDLRSTLTFVPFDAAGSAAIKGTLLDYSGAMSAPGEATQVANSAVTTATYTLTVAHYTLQHEVGYLVPITAGGGLDIPDLADKLVGSATLTLTDMIAALFSGFTTSVGTTTVDLDVDDIYDAMFGLHTNLVSGKPACVLYPMQMNDFRSSLRGEAGVMQWQPASAEMLKVKGPGYQGEWNGVDFWSCDSVATANTGADSCGAMYVPGALAYTEAPVSKVIPYIPKVIASDSLRMFVESDNIGDYGKIRLIAHYFPAVIEKEDLRGVKIITDR